MRGVEEGGSGGEGKGEGCGEMRGEGRGVNVLRKYPL